MAIKPNIIGHANYGYNANIKSVCRHLPHSKVLVENRITGKLPKANKFYDKELYSKTGLYPYGARNYEVCQF